MKSEDTNISQCSQENITRFLTIILQQNKQLTSLEPLVYTCVFPELNSNVYMQFARFSANKPMPYCTLFKTQKVASKEGLLLADLIDVIEVCDPI